MSTEIKSPTFPESVEDGTIVAWHAAVGDFVKRDTPLIDIETDKVVMEVVAPASGKILSILKNVGDIVDSNEVIGQVDESASDSGEVSMTAETDSQSGSASKSVESRPATEKVNPAAQRLIEEHAIDASTVKATGKGGRITKSDVIQHLEEAQSRVKESSSPKPVTGSSPETTAGSMGLRDEKRVPMSRLRSRIAERLLLASQSTAMLTTFNEINMQNVMDLRSKYKEPFLDSHGVKLGFMSFFVKAATEALRRYPAVNASIDGSDIVYRGFQDIGVAVSTDRGLMVPILRNTEMMSLADIEKQIGVYSDRARDGQISLDDITGGTFTISNGGVFGSLLSTPLLNPPQTAILGMHKIQTRPVVEDGEIVARPMMYLALSYDHRLIDGKEAVEFLVAIKEMIEDPAKMLLEI